MSKLTEKQQEFIDLLFSEEINGDYKKAAKAVGIPVTQLMNQAVVDSIKEKAGYMMASNAPRAVNIVEQVMLDIDAGPGTQHKLKAALELLDRTGLGKQDMLPLKGEVVGVVILPPKKDTE